MSDLLSVLKVKDLAGNWIAIPGLKGADGNGIETIEFETDGTLVITDSSGTEHTFTEIKDAIDDVVIVSDEEPESPTNKIWINTDPTQGSVVVPTKDELLDVYPVVELSDQAEAVFPDGADDLSIKEVTVSIVPAQEGSGTPAPDNVRPLDGFTEISIFVSPTQDSEDGEEYIVTLPDEAGTVYAGILSVEEDGSATLTVYGARRVYDGVNNKFNLMSDAGTYKFVTQSNYSAPGYNTTPTNDPPTLWCNMYNAKGLAALGNTYIAAGYFRVCADPSFEDVAAFNTYLESHNLEYVFKLASPTVYHFSTEQIQSLLGENHIWSDAGKISVSYRADIALFVQKLINSQ